MASRTSSPATVTLARCGALFLACPSGPHIGSDMRAPNRARLSVRLETQARSMIFRTAAAMAIFLASLLASATAAPANILTIRQATPLFNLSDRVAALERDILQALKVLRGTDDYDCLSELHSPLRIMHDYLTFGYDLAMLSAQMRDPLDEASVNETLSAHSTFSLNMLAEARQYALTQGALCSGSAVVNTYAQKTATLADEAAALFSGINRTLCPVERARLPHSCTGLCVRAGTEHRLSVSQKFIAETASFVNFCPQVQEIC
jgi:hypothetical protein